MRVLIIATRRKPKVTDKFDLVVHNVGGKGESFAEHDQPLHLRHGRAVGIDFKILNFPQHLAKLALRDRSQMGEEVHEGLATITNFHHDGAVDPERTPR
jgi:hypothetical protein